MFGDRSRPVPHRAGETDATANGDAVLIVSSSGYVPTPPQKSFAQLVPRESQVRLVERALASFGKSD